MINERIAPPRRRHREVFSFKQPSAEELEHDFIRRDRRLPERRRIDNFNQSYYEKMLVVHVCLPLEANCLISIMDHL